MRSDAVVVLAPCLASNLRSPLGDRVLSSKAARMSLDSSLHEACRGQSPPVPAEQVLDMTKCDAVFMYSEVRVTGVTPMGREA